MHHDKVEVPLDEVVVENLPEEYLNKNRVPPNEQHHGKDNVSKDTVVDIQVFHGEDEIIVDLSCTFFVNI